MKFKMLQNVASDQVLHCLPLTQQFLDTSAGSKMDLFKILGQVCKELRPKKKH